MLSTFKIDSSLLIPSSVRRAERSFSPIKPSTYNQIDHISKDEVPYNEEEYINSCES